MPNMPQVDTNRLKGNYAQAVVAEWLSRSCLVRPVAEGTDIGVDLYCEAVVDQAPYLHFWAQVKAIPCARLVEKDGATMASFSFETRHLRYWERQPIPVYAFLVPLDDWPPTSPERVFGVRITEHIVRHGLPATASTTLTTSDSFGAATVDADISQFLLQIVPWDTSALLLRQGIVAPIPQLADQPEAKFPTGIGFQYLPRVLDTIRDASVHGLYHALLAEQVQPVQRPVRKKFESIAQFFESQMHPYGLSMLVRAAHKDGEIEKAKAYVTSAIARIQGDQRLAPDEKARQVEKVSVLLRDFD